MKNSLEIERKFLVDINKLPDINLAEGKTIKQFYMINADNLNLRFRIIGNDGLITIKSDLQGISRREIETNVSVQFIESILIEYDLKVLEKIRVHLFENDKKWELDFFQGKFKGLVLAEIELFSEEEEINIPNWVQEEVSYNPDYYNDNLYKQL